MIAETGYPGFAIYLGFVGSIILYADRQRRRIKKVAPVLSREIQMLEAGTLAFLAACSFGTLPYLPHFLLQLVMLYSSAEIRGAAVDQALGGAGGLPASGQVGGTARRRGAAPVPTARTA